MLAHVAQHTARATARPPLRNCRGRGRGQHNQATSLRRRRATRVRPTSTSHIALAGVALRVPGRRDHLRLAARLQLASRTSSHDNTCLPAPHVRHSLAWPSRPASVRTSATHATPLAVATLVAATRAAVHAMAIMAAAAAAGVAAAAAASSGRHCNAHIKADCHHTKRMHADLGADRVTRRGRCMPVS